VRFGVGLRSRPSGPGKERRCTTPGTDCDTWFTSTTAAAACETRTSRSSPATSLIDGGGRYRVVRIEPGLESSNGAAKAALGRSLGLFDRQRPAPPEPKPVDHRAVLVGLLRSMGEANVAELLREAGYEVEL
jgi:hypothetical protein